MTKCLFDKLYMETGEDKAETLADDRKIADGIISELSGRLGKERAVAAKALTKARAEFAKAPAPAYLAAYLDKKAEIRALSEKASDLDSVVAELFGEFPAK